MISTPSSPATKYFRSTLLALGIAATATVCAQAQTIDPGLWELTSEMKTPGQADTQQQMADLQKQLESMPAGMRGMLEKQMASMGVGLGANGAIRVCITPEQASTGGMYDGKQEGGCTYSNVKHSGKTITGTMTCKQPAMRGDFVSTLHSNSHFATQAKLTGSDGLTEMTAVGRRLSADCGNIQPAKR